MNLENWDRNTPSNSPKAPGTKKFGKRKGPSRGLIQKCAPHERSPCAPKFEESSHEETLHQERCARKAAWDLAKHMHKLKNSDKTTFYIPGEVKGMSTPITSKRPEEREFVVDSGASVHMMSKKELSSEEMGTVKRSRNHTVVLTADGEVHTHEEAQVFVHDLNQFVTVQLLEETLAVLTLVKLCKDHGYSYEWVSGQEPRLTNNGKSIFCKTNNFVPLVVPGLSVNSGSSSSSTALPQESLGPDAHLVSGNRAASSSSSGSVLERSDEPYTRKLGQEFVSDDKKNADDPLADLPFWFEDSTDNLEATELPAPAHSSRESDLEHPVEVVTKSRRHSINTNFPKDRNCHVCLRTKITKASCRRRTGEAQPRAEEFGDLITADHKVLNEGGESRDNHRYAVVLQDLATQRIQSYPCKTRSSHETEKAY